ncbi:MAG: insulinase family protein [Chloracidobacterium sp.]|nr:insulinase family protein [Chloracidobacterium sp.]
MKKFLIILGLSVITAGISFGQAVATAPTPQTVAGSTTKIPYVSKVLANGLEVIVYPDSGVPLVTVEMAVRNGSFTEPPELNGLSHLYEHMFFKTNKAVGIFRCDYAKSLGRMDYFLGANCGEQLKLKSQIGDTSYINLLDQSGYVRNGTTQEEYVNYYFTATSPNLETLMRAMRDAMLFPSFDEREFSQEIQVVLGELDRQQSEPGYYLDRTLMDKLFYKYPSRKSPGGTRETVASATTEKMRLIQSRYYVPNNAALLVTGDVEPNRIFALAEQLFGDWKRGDDPFIKFPLVEHPPLLKSEGIFVTQDVENVIVQIGWQGPSIGKDNASTYAADVFSFIVGQPDSRFQREMIDSGLAVSADVHYYTQRNVGPIRITLVTTPDKAKAAVAKIYSEIAKFNASVISPTKNLRMLRHWSSLATFIRAKSSANIPIHSDFGGRRPVRIIIAATTKIFGRSNGPTSAST